MVNLVHRKLAIQPHPHPHPLETNILEIFNSTPPLRQIVFKLGTS